MNTPKGPWVLRFDVYCFARLRFRISGPQCDFVEIAGIHLPDHNFQGFPEEEKVKMREGLFNGFAKRNFRVIGSFLELNWKEDNFGDSRESLHAIKYAHRKTLWGLANDNEFYDVNEVFYGR